jgi:hypothetical protein
VSIESANTAEFRALVCVTTCQRLVYLRAYLPHVARVCADDPRFTLVVSLDGTDPETLSFCNEWGVPLVYSDLREGVGLSKNRVLERFPDFDYYFFLEDDVEVFYGSIFATHVALAQASDIHHFSLFEPGGVRSPIGESSHAGYRIVHCLYGGGVFNFFTGIGLQRVGGWHTRFARYRRWGHTEHSYRFPRVGLAPAAFNVAVEASRTCIWHAHPPVTSVPGVPMDADQIAAPERDLMDQELRHVPVQTLSPHHINDVPLRDVGFLASTLAHGDRYPLLRGIERSRAWSDYHVWRYQAAGAWGPRGIALVAAALRWPRNPALRHAVKTTLLLK